MMNGVSLVFHYRLLFYVGVNSNGGAGRKGEGRIKEKAVGKRLRHHPPFPCSLSLYTLLSLPRTQRLLNHCVVFVLDSICWNCKLFKVLSNACHFGPTHSKEASGSASFEVHVSRNEARTTAPLH